MAYRTKFFLLVLGLASHWAIAHPTYDLPQLERQALESNRTLFAGRDQVNAARAAITSASAFPNPEIEYLAGSQQPRQIGGISGRAQSTTLTQAIDLPWRRQARIATAEAGVEVSEASYNILQADLLARLRNRYFEVLRREAELKNAQEDRTLMEKIRSRIALRVETGEAPRFELIKADAEALNAQKTAQAMAFRLEQARSQLNQSIGNALPAGFTLLGSLRDAHPVPPMAQLRQRLQEKSPDLARSRAEMVRAERQLAQEKTLRGPNVALKAGLDQDPEMRSSKFGLVVSIPLWDRRAGPVDEAAAQLARARHQFEADEFSLSQALEVAYQQYEIATTQVTALESGIVRQTEAALRVAEAAYRFGERGFLEVLDAQRVHRAARAELINARYELAAAWVEIERLRAAPGGNTQ